MEWIGVDLDGTLAYVDPTREWGGPEDIGPPIPAMVERVKRWIAEGEDVRILTARVSSSVPRRDKLRTYRAVGDWCLQHLGTVLPVTAEKDHYMRELWDDRAVAVEHNTGRVKAWIPLGKAWRIPLGTETRVRC